MLEPGHLLLHEGELVAQAPAASTTPTPPAREDEQVTMRLPVRPGAPELKGKLEEFERAQILEALAKTTGNQTRAAKLLGIARRTLIKKMVRYGIEPPRAAGSRADGDTRHCRSAPRTCSREGRNVPGRRCRHRELPEARRSPS